MFSRRHIFKSVFILTLATGVATQAHAKNCLWKATSESGTLYIQGSVHLLKASDYPLPAAIENAYAKCNALVLEVDIKSMTAPETQQLIMAKALFTDGKTLKSTLGSETYALFSEKLTDAGLPVAALQQMKPWFVALTLMMTKMQTLGFDPELGLDQYFYNKAVADKKVVIGLETVKFQINLFDSLAEGNQDDYIQRTLKEMDLFETQLGELMKAWRTGDVASLNNLLRKSFADFPKLYDSFVLDRNKAWAKKIENLTSKDATHMVLVGAAHLPGEEGLLELLQKKGYTLEQL